ncbi:MAG: hypothetical protein IKZ82_05385 [Clostridia bacterium]|nr:hypothetical protein [Clostridia bacterium]
MSNRYAVIDIGSNSVRALFQGDGKKYSVTTRLGTNLANTGRLDNQRAKHSVGVIAAFVNEAKSRGLVPLAYATSAVRDAENRSEFIEFVKLYSSIDVDVLSGEREAHYAHMGACGGKGGLIDIGGASMQLISESFKKSFPVGCIRGKDIALELTKDEPDPACCTLQREALAAYLDGLTAPYAEELKNATFAPCIGVGGTITTLCALSVDPNAANKKVGEGASLTRDMLEKLISALDMLGAKRAAIGVLSARHDVILYGAALLARAMDMLSLDSITSSLRDGLDGYLDAAIRGEISL